MRTIHNFVQGTPEWHEHRRKCHNASDAAAALNDSPYVSRRELLKRIATGIEKEHDPATLLRFAKGHELEAQARVWAEEIIGEELFPVTMSDTIDGMLLSASLDGQTMLETINWEHKQLNKEIEEHLKDGRIPSRYYWQMEQGLLISGAEKCLFMASNGTKESMLYAWYYPSADVRKQLLAGWKQFEQDLATYEHVEVAAAPVAAAIDSLPALMVQVEGKVLATNLDAFVGAAKTFIDGIKTELVSDQDFADADKMTKFLKDGEEQLSLVKSQALAQTQSIEHLFRTIDDISAQMRSKRLALEKLVKSEKENRRDLLLHNARKQITDHVRKIDERLGGKWMPSTVMAEARLGEAIKGLKSLDSMHNKLDGAVSTARLEADEIADCIAGNRNLLIVGEVDYMFLFPDFASVCTKTAEDFLNLMKARITTHEEAQAAIQKTKEPERAPGLQFGTDSAPRPAISEQIDEENRQSAQWYADRYGASHPQPLPLFPTDTESVVTGYLQLLPISAVEKKALKLHLEKFVKYWQAKMNMEVDA